MTNLEIIRSLREACQAALPLVQRLAIYTPNFALARKCVAAEDLIEHAISLNHDTGKPGREPTPLYEAND